MPRSSRRRFPWAPRATSGWLLPESFASFERQDLTQDRAAINPQFIRAAQQVDEFRVRKRRVVQERSEVGMSSQWLAQACDRFRFFPLGTNDLSRGKRTRQGDFAAQVVPSQNERARASRHVILLTSEQDHELKRLGV